ncbi:MAG: hypothetical protein AAGH15_01070 [Myxococcota bacterium]
MTRNLLALALALALPSLAFAEGSTQLGTTQALRRSTQLYVDILDPAVETITWTGTGTVTVTDPDGATVGTYASGATVTPTLSGAYGVLVNADQSRSVGWDVSVDNQTDSLGRLFSYDWAFNAGSFSASAGTNASFFALMPAGNDVETAVIELDLEGLAGYVYEINANATGVVGPNAGRSVPQSGNDVLPLYAIYLNPPSVATYAVVVPTAYGLDYIGGVSTDVSGATIDPCNQLVPGESFGRFQFNTNVEGTYHLECDLNQDGVFDPTSDEDFLAVGETTAGLNTRLWDGTDGDGTPVGPGTYECRIRINVGEFHYVGRDIETSYQGMRMFEVRGDLSRVGLTMFWNDSAVQANARTMANGELGLETSGPLGMDSGSYAAPAVANVNARSWGNNTSGGKGNVAYLDTYVYLATDTSSTIEVEAVDASVDTDADGLGDFEESCFYGTDPEDPDTDDDGVLDGAQYAIGASSGSVGGLESNGRLSGALARRAIRRSRVSEAAIGRVPAALRDPGFDPVLAPLEDIAFRGLERVDATPSDLPAITNADEVLAYDYRSGDETVATVLAVQTQGALYEHSKALCDRAGGATLVDAGLIAGERLVQATYQHLEEATRDAAIELKLYERPDGRWTLASHWLRGDYAAAEADQRVVNLQVWSHRPGLARELVAAYLDALEASEHLHVRGGAVLDETTVATLRDEPRAPVRAPSVVVRHAALLGAGLTLDLGRLSGGDRPVTLRLDRAAPDGTTLPLERIELGSVTADRRVTLDVGMVRDLTVDVLALDRDGTPTLVDQVWLSDGAWAPYDDALWGGATRTADFDTTCPGLRPAIATGEGALPLSGCARVRADAVDRFAGVARHVSRGVSLEGYGQVAFRYRSDAPVEACAESTRSGERSCVRLPAAPDGGEGALGLAPLRAAGAAVHLVSVTRASAGTLEVAGLTFAKGTPPAVEEAGCAALPGSAGLVPSLAFVLALVRRRRRR